MGFMEVVAHIWSEDHIWAFWKGMEGLIWALWKWWPRYGPPSSTRMEDHIWAFWKGRGGGWKTIYGLSGRGVEEDGKEDGRPYMGFLGGASWRMVDGVDDISYYIICFLSNESFY